MKSIEARLPSILARLDFMGKGLGVEMPDPYAALGAFIEDLEELWRSELASSIRDREIAELIVLLFTCKAELEQRGLRKHVVHGVGALERVEPYPELAQQLELTAGLLEVATKERLRVLSQVEVP